MKKEQILLFLLFISSTVFGQQHVEPYMIDMPRDTIRYVVNGEKRNVTIARYYISQYPESMRQYKEYLAEHDSLENLEATKRIYPNRVNLALCGLNDDEIDFIISEYFVEPQYDDYPIVGLDYQQIKEYLDWKVERVIKRVLREHNIINSDSLAYSDLFKGIGDTMDISLPPNFLIPTECHAVLAFKEKGKHLPQGGIMEVKRNVDSTEIEHPIIDRLKLTSIYKLDLSYGGTFDHLDELIYDTQVLGKGPYQSLYISEKSNGQFVKRKHPNQLMKPWRVWSINVSNKLK